MYYDASAESWRMDEVIPQLPYVNGSLDIQVYSLPKVCQRVRVCACVRMGTISFQHAMSHTQRTSTSIT
jgi:hypothetical protein